MPTFFQGSIRKTHMYVDPWDTLDQWEDIPGRFKELGGSKYYNPVNIPGQSFGISDCGYRVIKVITPKNLSVDMQRRVIIDQYTSVGCDHDYDCCGCYSFRAYATKLRRRGEWTVKVVFSRNY
jgi:hypothetical protein